MIVLGVETTSDETAVSVVRGGRDVLGERLLPHGHLHGYVG